MFWSQQLPGCAVKQKRGCRPTSSCGTRTSWESAFRTNDGSKSHRRFPVFHGVQLAIDTTLVSPIRADRELHPRCVEVDGAALELAQSSPAAGFVRSWSSSQGRSGSVFPRKHNVHPRNPGTVAHSCAVVVDAPVGFSLDLSSSLDRRGNLVLTVRRARSKLARCNYCPLLLWPGPNVWPDQNLSESRKMQEKKKGQNKEIPSRLRAVLVRTGMARSGWRPAGGWSQKKVGLSWWGGPKCGDFFPLPTLSFFFCFFFNFRDLAWNCGGVCAILSLKMSSQRTNLEFSGHFLKHQGPNKPEPAKVERFSGEAPLMADVTSTFD